MQQRHVSMTFLTTAGWISGTLHVPPTSRLVDFLDHCRDFVPLTSARVEAREDVLEFFALRRRAIVAAIPPAEESLASAQATQRTEDHGVWCLLPWGSAQGRLDVPASTRISDYLAKHAGWLVLRSARLHLRDPWSLQPIDRDDAAVLVGPEHVVGATEARPKG